ncbi:MAG: UDP-N-acetylmuramate dehydrogenase [Spirochaetia bacterium]
MDFSFLKSLKIPSQEYRFNVSMADHTWFKTGGPAACLLQTTQIEVIPQLLYHCDQEGIPLFFLGDGSNLVVSDRGFSGIIIDVKSFSGGPVSLDSHSLTHTLPAGWLVIDVVKAACEINQAGVEDFYGLPGTVGGAVFMNASCYDIDWASVFVSAEVITIEGKTVKINKKEDEWDYKKSPLQNGALIKSATIKLKEGPGSEKLQELAQTRYDDREKKGHFLAPCAGSIFKNNFEYGQPSGKIIDDAGLRGYKVGDAQVSPNHANIIINAGNAKGQDIYNLTMEIQATVQRKYGHMLEPEVVFLGDFS